MLVPSSILRGALQTVSQERSFLTWLDIHRLMWLVCDSVDSCKLGRTSLNYIWSCLHKQSSLPLRQWIPPLIMHWIMKYFLWSVLNLLLSSFIWEYWCHVWERKRLIAFPIPCIIFYLSGISLLARWQDPTVGSYRGQNITHRMALSSHPLNFPRSCKSARSRHSVEQRVGDSPILPASWARRCASFWLQVLFRITPIMLILYQSTEQPSSEINKQLMLI